MTEELINPKIQRRKPKSPLRPCLIGCPPWNLNGKQSRRSEALGFLYLSMFAAFLLSLIQYGGVSPSLQSLSACFVAEECGPSKGVGACSQTGVIRWTWSMWQGSVISRVCVDRGRRIRAGDPVWLFDDCADMEAAAEATPPTHGMRDNNGSRDVRRQRS